MFILSMVVGLLHLILRIPESRSLKSKRQVLLSLKTRIRNGLNVSVSEVDHQDQWQIAALAVACVGGDRSGVNRVLSRAVEMVERERELELSDYTLEFF